MSNRSLLHQTKLGELKKWLNKNHVKWRESDRERRVIQIRARTPNGPFSWVPIYNNLDSDYLIVPDVLIGIISTFILESKNGD